MEGNQTILNPPPPSSSDPLSTRNLDKDQKAFTFDRSFWSAGDKLDSDYASQRDVYDYLGRDIITSAIQGFNACVFAYGQTGSGKSYSMMGYGSDKGLIPLVCEALFQEIDAKTSDTVTFTCECSFMEIYQEKVRDLLNPANKGNLKVREHPSLGPYVEGLSKLVVQDFAGIESLMDEGNKARTVAATNMNETSSRSHSIFTILLTQKTKDDMTGMAGEKVSRISLVDLAGSERANATGATGTRLKEGALINKSLTTLGKTIAALAQASSTPKPGKKAKDDFVPYRDSVLTWLLKDSLGGNSKTAMIAAISPADYEETLSTLRYADAAKRIKNKAVVNEDQNGKIIRELKEELLLLRSRLSGSSGESTYDINIPPEKQVVTYQTKTGEIKTVTKAELQDQLDQSEKLMADINQTWEEKLQQTHSIQKQREEALEALGISIDKNIVGVHTPKRMPHLVNLNEDPLMSECLIYQIQSPGKTMVGSVGGLQPADIRLSGEGIRDQHCYFKSADDGSVHLYALEGGITMVNGQRIDPTGDGKKLKSGYRVIIGEWHVFRFNHPVEVKKSRDRVKAAAQSSLPASPRPDAGSGVNSPLARPGSPVESTTSAGEDVDWSFARREAVVARLNGTDVDLDKLPDGDLNTLYRDIRKVRSLRQGGSVSRPESRLSHIEADSHYDGESSSESRSTQPFSGETWATDDTSFESSAASANERLIRQELEQQLEQQRKAYEAKIEQCTHSTLSLDDVTRQRVDMDAKVSTLQAEMQQKLEIQKKQFEAKLQKAKKKNAAGDTEIYTADQLRLIRAVVTKWRQLNKVSMAEQALQRAVDLKEANVISKELGKQTTYQFVILDSERTRANPVYEGDNLADVDQTSKDILIGHQPHLAIKVIDRQHVGVRVWTMAEFTSRLAAMRNLYKVVDRSSHSQHLDWSEPFYGGSSEADKLSFVGVASMRLPSPARHQTAQQQAEIRCPFTLSAIGVCTIKGRLRSTDANVQRAKDTASEGQGRGQGRDTFETVSIQVSQLEGLSTELFQQVAIQIKYGPIAAAASGIVDCDEDTLSHLSLALDVDAAENDTSLQYNLINVELFARLRPSFLAAVLDWDASLSPKTRPRLSSAASFGRRPEVELIQDQCHDVIMTVSISELDGNGEYSHVQLLTSGNGVDPGVFFLRQGLQRRLEVFFRHTSGRSWQWQKITKISIQNIRQLDSKGIIRSCPTGLDIELPRSLSKEASFEQDGTCSIDFDMPWDSSAHGSKYLNRVTAAGSRVLLHLCCQVEALDCSPALFELDIAITISARDAKPPSSRFLSFFGPERSSTKCTSLFSAKLSAAVHSSAADLWRHDTSAVYVRGEETLGTWKPHGVGLVELYFKQLASQRKRDNVDNTRHKLAGIHPSRLLSGTYGENESAKIRRALRLWQRRFGSQQDIQLQAEPQEAKILKSLRATKKRMLVETVMVPRSTTCAKQSYLHVLLDSTSNSWKKQWFALRRPYLYIYDDSQSTDFVTVINTSQVRVETSPEMEDLLRRRNAFAIYTSQNCYFLQSDSPNARNEWMLALDPGFLLPHSQ